MSQTAFKEFVESKGFNEEKLASASGLSRATVRRHIRNGGPAKADICVKYAKAIGVEPNDIFVRLHSKSSFIGTKAGDIEVVKFHEVKERLGIVWECKCSCSKPRCYKTILRTTNGINFGNPTCGCPENEDNLLSKIMQERRLSPEDVSRGTGLCRETVGLHYKGHQKASISNCCLYASFFGVPPQDFLVEIGAEKYNMAGKAYGKLVAKELKRVNVHGGSVWACECTCGLPECEQVVEASANQLEQSKKTRCLAFRQEDPLSNRNNFLSCMESRYRNSAGARGITWSLSSREFESLVVGDCHYCGSEPSVRKIKKRTLSVNGIDRVDSGEGYKFSNCVPCCSKCNYGKGTLSKEEFVCWAKRVAEHNG